jgi:hypothetical protein
MNKNQNLPLLLLVIAMFFLAVPKSRCQSSHDQTGLRTSAVSYHLSFDDDAFFTEDIIEQSGKKSLEERKIDFPPGKFGKGIRMKEIPQTPDANNMTGIDLDLVTAVIFNTHPGNEMGFNQPFIWGSGRINARLGAVAFWARGALPFAGPLFEQTSVGFGRKERDLLGIVVDEANILSAYIRDSRYVTHRLKSTEVWNSNEWNHVAFNWDWANGMELWINGNKIASSWGQQAWFETTLPGLFHLPAAGLIYDEFYLFDRPITQNEIKDLISSNIVPGEEPILYKRQIHDEKMIGEISGAEFTLQLPKMYPGQAAQISEVWPGEVSDEHVPGWFVVDGRNEIAWPHPYSMFTIIPGDADFHAEKVDLKMAPGSKVNYVTLTGNLTNVSLQASTPRELQMLNLFQVPLGKEFFYGSIIKLQEDATFRIPFTERYGTPEGFSGDINLPLSGEKRIQNIGFYHYKQQEEKHPIKGKKLTIGFSKKELEKRIRFVINALTSRDERNFVVASEYDTTQEATLIDIGSFSRLNILSDPYDSNRGIKSVSFSLPIKTVNSNEALFIRVRDPAVPSRLWNQFALTLDGFNKEFGILNLTIDFEDIVVAEGDRLWIDLGTSGEAQILIGDRINQAAIFVEETETYISLDAYTKKEIVSAEAQYAKMYEFMPWQFTGKTVTLTDPYCYGGPFDMIMPALAIKRVKPEHFVANYLIRMSGPDFKDGKPVVPQKTELITLPKVTGTPEWALYMRDFNLKREAIVDWWSGQQNEDGQLGGGWNDDVLFLSFHQPDLPLDGNDKARYLIDASHKGLEKTNYFKDGFCNIYPMDRMHIGDFISERYNTVLNNLGQAYAFERELESAWRLDKKEQTPINYFADGFKSSVNIFNWYWGNDVPQQPYVSKSLQDLASEFRLYTSVLDDDALYRFTQSNVHRDDFSPFGANNMYTYLLGGRRGSRLDAHMELAVTWPSGGGSILPRIVLYADDTKLDLVAYSFDREMRELEMRLCRIKSGEYTIRIYRDSAGAGNPGKLLWEEQKELRRFDIVTLPIPALTPVLIRVEQIKPGEQTQTQPDLAIDLWDAVFEDEMVSCVIHNLGNAAAENIVVQLFDGETLLKEKTIDLIDAPVDFLAKRQTIQFDQVKFSGNLQIKIDPRNKISEILEDNNQAFVYKKGNFERGLTPMKN